MIRAFVAVPHRLLFLNLKISSRKLSQFTNIWEAFGAVMHLLGPKGRRGSSVGLLYYFILSVSGYAIRTLTFRYSTIASIGQHLKYRKSYINRIMFIWGLYNDILSLLQRLSQLHYYVGWAYIFLNSFRVHVIFCWWLVSFWLIIRLASLV